MGAKQHADYGGALGLRWTTVLVTCGLLVAGLAGLYLALDLLIGASFAELEERQAQADLARAANSVGVELEQLSRSVRDWATWDASYAFMAGEAPNFLEENLLDPAFVALEVNLIAFLDPAGRPVVTKAFDLATGAEQPLPRGLASALGVIAGGLEGSRSGVADKAGVVLLPEEVLLVATRPILTSSGAGPARGQLVMARFVDRALEERFARETAIDLALARADRPPAGWLEPGVPPPAVGSPLVLVKSRSHLVTVGVLPALDGGSGLLLRVTLPRDIHAAGKRTSLRALVSLLVAGLLFAAGIALHLDRSVVARVLRIRAALGEVEKSGNLTRRLPEEGRDELTELAAAANRTLASLAASRRGLEEREVRYRQLFEANPSPMWVYDLDTLRFLAVNEAAVRWYGYSTDEFLDMTLRDLRPPEDVPRLEASVASSRARSGYERSAGWRHCRKDGSLVDVEILSHELLFEGRSARMVLAHDVTDRLKAERSRAESEARLRQAQKMEAVGRLAGGVAHDFNNLLQVILGLVEVIRSETDSLATRDRVLGELEEHAHRGAQLTRQLLLFSRRQASHVERLDLRQVVRDTTALLRRLVRENVTLDLSGPREPLPVAADRGQLEQVLMNLVLNASEAMPGSGRIWVRTRWEDQWVCLEVADSGCGIPEELQALVFDPFFTTKEHGTGLGLAVVHGVVTGAGGTVELQSHVGSGTSVVVRLPRAGAGVTASRIAAAAPAVAAGCGERILVVEDDAGVRFALGRVLRGLGYHVETADAGGQALALPAEPAFDLILTDQVLPDTTGVELVAHLADRWPKAEVLLMSGYTEDDETRDRVARGTLRFLAKPFSAADLNDAVQAALAARQTVRPGS